MTFRKLSFSFAWLGYIGLFGLLGFILKPLHGLRFLSLFCAFFAVPYVRSPRFLPAVVVYAFGQGLAFIRHRGSLPRPGVYSQKTDFVLPFQGEWLAASGGFSRKDSHSWDVLNQRYAYDFLIQDERGLTHVNDGRELGDYYCYGRPIYAPADGVMIQVNDGIPDNPRLGVLDWRARDFRGNFVIIKHEGDEFSLLAHFQMDSLKIRPGERVKRGQLLGHCGNSGYSLEPHLHFHVQDRPNFFLGVGLPIAFSHFLLRTAHQGQEVKRGPISKGGWVMSTVPISRYQNASTQEKKAHGESGGC